MTKKEALQILAILKAAYPSSYNGMTKEEASGTVAIWCMQFADMPIDIVMMAVHKLISTNKFPPTVSEVKDKIRSIHYESFERLHSNLREFLTEAEIMQYQRICDLTQGYTKCGGYTELPLSKLMMIGSGGDTPKIGNGGY